MRLPYYLLAVLLLTACTTLNLNPDSGPIVTLTHLNLGEVGLLSQTYQLELLVENPTPVPLPVAGITYSLDINGKRFARGVSDHNNPIPAFGKQRIQVEITSNVLNLIEQIHRWRRAGIKRFSYKLDGKLHLSGGLSALSFRTRDSLDLRK